MSDRALKQQTTRQPSELNQSAQNRVAKLEELLMHQQHTIEQLNEIVIQLRGDLEKLQQKIDKQELTINEMETRFGDDLPHEKPPHY